MRRQVVFASVLALAATGCPPEATAPTPRTPGPQVPAPPPPDATAAPVATATGPGWIGLSYGPPEDGQGPGGARVVVKGVMPGSPAARVGIAEGEGILKVEGRDARSPDYLMGVLDTKRAGETLRLVLVGEDGATREARLDIGTLDTAGIGRRAIERGAAFLAARFTDGGWVRKGSEALGVDIPLTALCARALVELPPEVGGAHAATLDSAVATLLSKRVPEGAIVGAPDRVHFRNYATTLTLQTLARLGRPAHAQDIAAMTSFLVAAQLDDEAGISEYDFPRFGAWNYHDNNRPATIRADISATAYATHALGLVGLDPASVTATQALLFLERTQNLPIEGVAEEEQALLDGGFAFNPRDSKAGRQVFPSGRVVFRSYGSATADGLRSLLALGVSKDDPRVKAAVGWLARNFSARVNPGFRAEGVFDRAIYYYYLDAVTDALARHGEETLPDGVAWKEEVLRRLVSLQTPEGSWSGEIAVMNEDDPAQATAFALLALSRCVGGGP